MSPDPNGKVFEQEIHLRKWDLTTHRTAGMRLLEKNGRLLLASIDASTPAARIARWHTHLCGAWLVSINGTPVETIKVLQLMKFMVALLCLDRLRRDTSFDFFTVFTVSASLSSFGFTVTSNFCNFFVPTRLAKGIGAIIVKTKSGYEDWFKMRKPKYIDYKKTKNRLTGEEMEIIKSFSFVLTSSNLNID